MSERITEEEMKKLKEMPLLLAKLIDELEYQKRYIKSLEDLCDVLRKQVASRN